MMRSECGEQWIKYYSSSHDILLLGEGDFSFSVCLALTFRSATNIVATTLASYEGLINKYKHAQANLMVLESLGASVLHGVDATQMTSYPYLRHKKFHRIIYNFPHAGFHGKEKNPIVMSLHRDLVRRFLLNASRMLCVDGEVHVNHKATAPFHGWRIQNLGTECSLFCFSEDEFRIQDYPGYSNKRGSGERADESFPLGSCKTYRFRLGPAAAARNLMMSTTPQTCVPPRSSHVANYDEKAALQNYYASECCWIFKRYLNHVEETFGDTSHDTRGSVVEAMRYGYEMYMRNAEAGRPLSEFTRILEELYSLSVSRSERLRQLVHRYDVE